MIDDLINKNEYIVLVRIADKDYLTKIRSNSKDEAEQLVLIHNYCDGIQSSVQLVIVYDEETQSEKYTSQTFAHNVFRCELIQFDALKQIIDNASIDLKRAELKEEAKMREKFRNNSKGAYIDRLRLRYPYKIRKTSDPQEQGTLKGLSLSVGLPIYRLCGMDWIVNPFEDERVEIVEW